MVSGHRKQVASEIPDVWQLSPGFPYFQENILEDVLSQRRYFDEPEYEMIEVFLVVIIQLGKGLFISFGYGKQELRLVICRLLGQFW